MIIPEKISLVTFNLLKSVFHVSEEVVNQPLDAARIEVNINLNHGFDFEKKLMFMTYGIGITASNEKGEKLEIGAEFTMQFVVHVQNLEEFVKETEDQKVIDKRIGTTAVGITYSTMRGIVLSQLMGTKLQGVFLPVLDPGSLLTGVNK